MQNEELKKLLIMEFWLSQDIVEILLEDYEPDYINEKIPLIRNTQLYKDGAIAGYPNLFMCALKNDI